MAPKSKSKKSSKKSSKSSKSADTSSSDVKQPYDPDKSAIAWDQLPPELRPGFDMAKNGFIEHFLSAHETIINLADEQGHNRDKVIKKIAELGADLYSMGIKYSQMPTALRKKYSNPTMVAPILDDEKNQKKIIESAERLRIGNSPNDDIEKYKVAVRAVFESKAVRVPASPSPSRVRSSPSTPDKSAKPKSRNSAPPVGDNTDSKFTQDWRANLSIYDSPSSAIGSENL